MDRVRDVLDGRSRVQRDRLVVRLAPVPEEDAHEAGQPPDLLAQAVEALVVEHRDRYDVELRERRDARVFDLVCLRQRDQRRQLDARGLDLRAHDRQLLRRRARRVAEHDRVRVPEDAEQCAPSAPVLVRAFDQAGDLDELNEDAADAGEGGNGSRRREGVVARLDLDRRQRLEQRRLPRVRRADQRDLRCALAPDGDRVAVDDLRPRAGLLELTVEPLAEVRVGAAAVVRQLREQPVDDARALASFLPDQPPLGDLGKRPVGHGHRSISFDSCRSARRPRVWAGESRLSCRFLGACAGSGGLAGLVGDGRVPGALRRPADAVIHAARSLAVSAAPSQPR